jgi:hypothetical protein
VKTVKDGGDVFTFSRPGYKTGRGVLDFLNELLLNFPWMDSGQTGVIM